MDTPNCFLNPTHRPRYSSFCLNSAASTEHVEAAAVIAFFYLAVKFSMSGKVNFFRSSLETAEEVGGFSTNYGIDLIAFPLMVIFSGMQ